MIIRTQATSAAPYNEFKEMHSYTTPAILVLPVESVDPDYHAWIVNETQGEKT
jgi:periplasmic divalent cation tolerance protein